MLTFKLRRQCLLDSYSMSECPNCGRTLITITTTGEQQLLCNLKNEGGLQEGLDMLPILTEETYLKAFPEERKCRAFLEFCGEGDVEAIIDLLNDGDDGEGDEEVPSQGVGHSIDVLRYQDQIGSMGSGLHVAVQNQKTEVAWLLLFLASALEVDQFPAAVRAAQNLGIQREDQSGKADIRSLKDSHGMTAEQRAAGIGGAWTEWLQSGRLKPPVI